MNFAEFSLDKRILSGIEQVGFTEPTPIQEQAVPLALDGKDLIGLAQTGTGKTAAFVLPILERLSSGPLRRTRALIVAPTRELAEQIHESIVELSRNLRVRSTAVYGGVGKGKQIDALQKGTEIVVACPGRLLDLHSEGRVNLKDIEVLVLDEADRMCDMGFLPDVRRIIKLLPDQRQNLFFSATMPSDIRELVNDFMDEPETVQIGMIAPAKTVDHALFPIPQKQKKHLLLAMLEQERTGQVLIFTRTKYRARNLARDLDRKKYRAIALQGNMSQNRRQAAMNGFREGKYDILVATDIAARGIDVSNVTHVINFDMPDTVDAYTHRIGRTGRAEKEGVAYTFAVPDDAPMVRQIERLLKQPLARRRVDAFDYEGFEPETAVVSTPSSRQPSSNGGQRRRSSSSNGGNRRGGGNGRSGNSNRRRGRGRTSRRNSANA